MERADAILEQLMEHSPVSIQILGPDGTTIRVNDTYLKLFGRNSRRQVEGVYNPLTNPLIHDLGLDRYIERGLAGELVTSPPAPFQAPGMPEFELSGTVIPVPDESGGISNVVIMHQDITALKASELVQLRRNRLLDGLQAAFRRISERQDVEGVLQTTIDTAIEHIGAQKAVIWEQNEQRKWVVIANRGLSDGFFVGLAQFHQTTSLLQDTAEGSLTEGQAVLLAGGNADPRLAGYTELLAGEGVRWAVGVPMLSGDAVTGLMTLYKSGEHGFEPFETEASCLLANHAAIALHNARLFERLHGAQDELRRRIREVTEELDKVHAEAVANEKLAAIGFFAKEIAHGLRNPLNTITTSSYYLRSQCDKHDEKVERSFLSISRAISQAVDTISNLSTLAGGTAPELTDVSLNDVVDSVAAERCEMGETGFVTEQDSSLPPVRGDVEQLKQAIRSLLSNALASRRTEPVVIRTYQADGTAAVSVGDDRTPMSSEETAAAFGPFSASATQWTGLGLSVVWQLAAGHGGSADVSVEGGLTWFSLRLPIPPVD